MDDRPAAFVLVVGDNHDLEFDATIVLRDVEACTVFDADRRSGVPALASAARMWAFPMRCLRAERVIRICIL